MNALFLFYLASIVSTISATRFWDRVKDEFRGREPLSQGYNPIPDSTPARIAVPVMPSQAESDSNAGTERISAASDSETAPAVLPAEKPKERNLAEMVAECKGLFYQKYGARALIMGPVCTAWQSLYLEPRGGHFQYGWYMISYCEDGRFIPSLKNGCFHVTPQVLFELGYQEKLGHFTRCARYDGPETGNR